MIRESDRHPGYVGVHAQRHKKQLASFFRAFVKRASRSIKGLALIQWVSTSPRRGNCTGWVTSKANNQVF
jgi:hypothetical protein